MYPEQLKYTPEHEWVDASGTGDDSVRVGITDFAQEALGGSARVREVAELRIDSLHSFSPPQYAAPTPDGGE